MSIKAFCAWSGGKNSCLCFDRTLNEGLAIHALFTMAEHRKDAGGEHRLPVWALERQAAALRVPIVIQKTSAPEYEEKYLHRLRMFRERGYDTGIFGVVCLDARKKRAEELCAHEGLNVLLPLWGIPGKRIANEFIGLGYQAMIVAVRQDRVPASFLGRMFDESLLAELGKLGIDPYGETEDFHTFVVDGPLFRYRLRFNADGIEQLDGYAFLKLRP
jgi:uncharacterized protein (TIGR00290 family)